MENEARLDSRVKSLAGNHHALLEGFLLQDPRAIFARGGFPRGLASLRLPWPPPLLFPRRAARRLSQGAANGVQQALQRERLLDKIKGAELRGGHGGVNVAVT